MARPGKSNKIDDAAELNSERDVLQRADRHLSEGEQRIARQTKLASRLREGGHDTIEAERLVAVFQETLREWREHRALIVQRIAVLEARLAGPVG